MEIQRRIQLDELNGDGRESGEETGCRSLFVILVRRRPLDGGGERLHLTSTHCAVINQHYQTRPINSIEI